MRLVRRAFVVLALTAGVAACVDAVAPEVSSPSELRLAVVGPQSVSQGEVDALAEAFDVVEEYAVRIVDAQTLEALVDTVVSVTPGGAQHALDVVVPERSLGRSVTITLIAYGGGVELYSSVSTTTLGGTSGSASIELEIRYTGPGIRGRITDPSGAGVAGVSVNLMAGDAIVEAVQTEADGTYLFVDVGAGSYVLVPASPNESELVCPGSRQLSVTNALEAIVADFTTRPETCGINVLVVSGGDYDDTELVVSQLSDAPNLSVSTFFFVNQQPSLDLLAQQDVVLLFMNGLFDESAALGTRIAEYVELGGNVVIASFYWQGRSDSGLLSTGWGALEDIDPFTSTGGATYQAADLGTVSAHPLTAGLVELSSTGYRGGAAAKAGTTVVATWSDGTPLVGYRVLPGGQRMVGVTLFPGADESSSGDTQLLWYNAVQWAAAAPPPAPQPSAWVDLAVGAAHTCGLVEDGRAFCWGLNSQGQLGRLDLPGGATPRLASAALRFSDIEAGANTTCGLTDEGTAYCWGANEVGQVGSGSTAISIDGPEAVPGGPWARLAMGVTHACALDDAGAASCWGGGDEALGFETVESCVSGEVSVGCSRTPRPVDTDVRFSDISPGLSGTCAVGVDGVARCWGAAQWGQLGIGPYTVDDSRHEPAPVDGGATFRSVSVGGFHACGVSTSDVAYCWGGTSAVQGEILSLFDAGQVGQGGVPGDSPPALIPSPVVGGVAFSAVTAGVENDIRSLFTCGLTPAGAAYCWGRGGDGQLGTDPTPPLCDGIIGGAAPCTTMPLPVQGGHTFTRLGTGISFACALTSDDRMYCWGANGSGQRGDPTLASTAVPTEVALPG